MSEGKMSRVIINITVCSVIILAAVVFVVGGFGWLGCQAIRQYNLAAEEQQEFVRSHNESHHRKQVQLSDKDYIRPARDIKLGEGPFWTTTNAIVVDREGYMWLRSDAWLYPMKMKEIPVEVMPEVAGFSIKIKREEFPMPIGELRPSTMKKHGCHPVVKLTYEE
jgi:hypothetical protein